MATADYSYQTEHPHDNHVGETAYSANTFSHGYTPDAQYPEASSGRKHRSSRRPADGQSSSRSSEAHSSSRHSDSNRHRSSQPKDPHSSSRHHSSHADKERRHHTNGSGTERKHRHRSDRQSHEEQNYNGHNRHNNAGHTDRGHGTRGEASSYDNEMGMQLYAGTQPPSSHRRDNRHGNYNRYSQSTAFIPAAWDFANNRRGLVGLITQICTDIDNRVCPSAVSVVDDPNSVFDRSARGERSLPQGAYARVNTNPAYVRCPKCKRQVRTRISREIGTTSIVATAAAAAVVVAVNAPAAAYPLVALPLQLKMFKRKVHTCPECHFKMGRNVTIHIPE